MTLAIVGGYRLSRRVGEDSGADIWIGHPAHEGAERLPVVVKLYRAEWPAERIAAEIEALARAAGPHVVGVLDIATTVDSRTALILDRLGPRSLATLLTSRGSITPGEAVTVLSPLAQAISRMHAAGVVHRSLRAAAVVFSGHGAPVLTAFDEAIVLPVTTTRAQRDARPEFLADAAAFRALCEAVIDRIPSADGVRSWLEEHATAASWIDELPSRLFAWSASEPVNFEASPARGTPADMPGELRRSRASREGRSVVDRAVDLASTDWARWLTEHARRVRPRFWALGGGIVGLLVVAGFLLPAGDGEVAAGTDDFVAPTTAPTANPSADGAEEVVTGDDPAAALRVLLDTRAQCIRELSVLCLDAVAQTGSSALAQDQQLIRELQQGGGPTPVLFDGELSIQERLGGTALVVVTAENAEPASILVMRSEAGWRIRDYVE